MKIFKYIIGVFALIVCLGTSHDVLAKPLQPYEPFNAAKAQTLPSSALSIVSGKNTFKFDVELATTPEQRDIGLMHRSRLELKHGMLFDFQSEQIVRFWMRNTFIPLDMVFIRADGDVVAIVKNAQPHDETPVGPNEPVQAVLEIGGGVADLLGLKVGDKVTHAIFRTSDAQH